MLSKYGRKSITAVVVLALLLIPIGYIALEQNMADANANTGFLSGDLGIGNTISYAKGWDGTAWVSGGMLISQNQVTITFPAGDNITNVIIVFGNKTTEVSSLLQKSNIFYGISAASSGGLLTSMNVLIGNVKNGSAETSFASHTVVAQTFNATIYNAKSNINYLGETSVFPITSLLYSYPYNEPTITATMFSANETTSTVMGLTIFFEIYHSSNVDLAMGFAEMVLVVSMLLLLYVAMVYQGNVVNPTKSSGNMSRKDRRSIYWVVAAYAAIIAVSMYLAGTDINGAYLYGAGMLMALLFGAVTGIAVYSNFGSTYRLRMASISMVLGSLVFFFIQVTIYPFGSMLTNMAYYGLTGWVSLMFVFVDLVVVSGVSIPYASVIKTKGVSA